jgi:beta-galactosidase
MYPPYIRVRTNLNPSRPKSPRASFLRKNPASKYRRGKLWSAGNLRLYLTALLLAVAILCPKETGAQQLEPTLPISQRFTIGLAAGVPEYIADAASTSNEPQSHWWFQNTNNSTAYSSPGFVESSDTSANWTHVGLPYDANIPRTFINQTSGGGQGSLNGQNNWYRLHFKIAPEYANRKFMLSVEGSHTGVQVFINGTLLPGISAVAADAQATHVVGFIPVICDLTPYLHADGATDNVIAIDVSRGAPWYEQPNFSGAFRFGQAMAGLFRNVYLYVTNPVHIPLNVYSNQKTWGTYVGTVSEVPAAEGTATAASAVVEVQTNVLNETSSAQQVTLTTQIVDAKGNVVVTAPPLTQTVPAMTAATFPSGPAPMFNQLITIPNPTLWYPNNSIYGTPYLYNVYHIVSVDGVVVDSAQSTLGIRTITWDADFPYFNGHAMYLWGGASRYDYPALGSSVPDEQWWRDMAQIAAQGGNVWRPGHSTSSEEMVEAADAYGIMIDQPSGDGEGYWNSSSNPTPDDLQLKQELHRDMIIRDRSHPSILDWERDNGGMNPALADELGTLEKTWDNINPRVSADRTYSPAYGFMDECDGAGCEAGNKEQYPNNPAFGAEYWDDMGTGRGLAYDYELAFAAPYLNDWRQGREANAFGMSQWYFAESPGEISLWAEYQNDPKMQNFVRSLGYSSTDANRFPRLLYYIYQANWVPYSLKPVVHLAHHWNRAYEYTHGTPIQENAFSNCPAVRLLINGVQKDPVTGAILQDQTPNPWNIDSNTDLTENTTVMPGQAHWMVNWEPGTVTAECIDENGNPVAGVSDSRTTAGAEKKIVLSVVPEVVKPDGTSFQWTANGSDAAFVVAEVEDANGNIVPTASDNVTFSVTGPVAYMGGTQQLVADPSWTSYYEDAFSRANSNVIPGVPYAFFHSPGDPELSFEGGLQKIALRSTFTPGTVTVTASAPGLVSGSVTLTSVAPAAPSQSQAPVIIVPPVNTATTAGYSATFSVVASGSGTLTYQWSDKSGPISGATKSTYATPATTLAQSGDTYTVTVTNSLGDTTSNPVTLTVDAPAKVAITRQPASQSAVVGGSATLTVAATGSPALSYRWYLVGSGKIAGANQSSYATPVFTSTGTQSYYVVVANPLGQLQSSTAVVTINAPTPVSFTTQPASAIVRANEPVQLTAVVAGSAPYTYQWQFTPAGGTAIILLSGTQQSNNVTYTIPAVSSTDVGAYTVTVNNAANAPVTSASAQITLAPPGVNLALDKTATSSSTQNPCTDANTTPPYTGTGCLGPENAVDGNLSTRWGSAVANAPPTPPVPGVDPSWLQVDLGSVQAFNTIVIYWQNAYATQYQILYTSADPATNPTWNVAYTNKAGMGGTETLNFPTVTGRYIRMYGTQRATQYGYSIDEFQIYNVPQCGVATERYTIDSSNANLVTDNQTGLTWTRTIETDTAPGSQFTGVDAKAYCTSLKMRLPTKAEALGISGNNNATCAFPGVWSTWTSTMDPDDATKTAIVNFDGTSAYQVTNNYPGATLCASSPSGSPPTITKQPISQTVTAGQTANFSVVAAGAGTLAYQWYKNGSALANATSASYTTPEVSTADNGAKYYVVVSGTTKLSVTSNTVRLTVKASSCKTVPAAPAGLAATANSSSEIELSWKAVTPPASCTVNSYSVYRAATSGFAPSSTTLVASGLTETSYSNTGLKASTTYYYVVEALDAAGSSHPSTQVKAATQAPSVEVIAIAAGGPAESNAHGGDYSFVADEDYVGGGLNSPVTAAINLTQPGANAAPMGVYQHGRAGVTTYTIPGLKAGSQYTVLLHFAETYFDAAGMRVFNVAINGAAVLSNLDIFAEVGKAAALMKSFTAKANSKGQIVIAFTTGTANQPVVMGIEVRSTIVVPCTTVPVAPTNLAAAAISSNEIKLSWSAVAPPANCTVSSYNVYGSTTSGFAPSSSTLIASSVKGTSYSVTGLKASTTYYFVVEAVDADGSSKASAQVKATTQKIAGTAAKPVFEPPAATYTSTQKVSISDATLGVTIYYTTTGSAPTTASSVYSTPISVSASETLEAIAVKSDYNNSAVATANYVINTPPGTVEPPASLTAVASTNGQTYLNWAPSATPGVNYLVFRDTTPGFTPGPGNLVCTYSQSVNLAAASSADPYKVCTTWSMTYLADNNAGEQLRASTTYYYMVEAIDAAGALSSPAGAVAVTTQGASTSGSPTKLTGLTATAETPNEIKLTWNSSTFTNAGTVVITYRIYRGTTSSFTPLLSNQIGTTKANFFEDDLVLADSTYYYVVEAGNASETSPVSHVVSATTGSLGSAAPFWDMSNIPTPKNVLELKFLNRTNGKYADDQITWSATINGTATQNTLAAQPYFDMPANSSGRMYFYLGPVGQGSTDYYDFIEYTVGPASINFDTTRVDALGIKLAARLTCGDGTDVAVGENQGTFAEDRATTFARYLNEVTLDFQAEAKAPFGPYRIVEPGAGGFNAGGPYATYYSAYIAQIWSENGLTIPQAGPNGSGLGAFPDLSAAIFRHTAGASTFNPNGSLISQGMWSNPAYFFQTEPYDHYAQFITSIAINGQQYAFPYNDAGGYSSDVSCSNPKTLVVAIGW